MEQQKEPEKKATNFWDEPWEPDMSWKCGTPMLQDLKKKRERKSKRRNRILRQRNRTRTRSNPFP